MSRRPRFDRATFDGSALDAEPSPLGGERIAGEDVAVALAWFPAGEYERAISWWPTLAENWAGVAHEDYCRRFDANLKWLRAHGAPVRGVVAIRVASYVAWCGQHGEDPEEARAVYAARQSAEGHMVAWPPERNERCWCGSQRKYKKCCGASSPAPMLPAANERVVASDVLEVDARVRSE